VIAVLEPRSNTMKSGVHKDTLAASLQHADLIYVYQGDKVEWSVDELINNCDAPCTVSTSIDELVATITEQSQTNDTIVVMSNGGFGGIHTKLLESLRATYPEAE